MAEFQHPEAIQERFLWRLRFVGVAVLFAFVILFGRFVYLQVIKHDFYMTKAESNRISLVPIVPNRGVITDRNGVILARNYSAFTLEIFPRKVQDIESTINQLAEIIDIQAKDRKRFKRLLDESKNFESIPIRTHLSDAEVARFTANHYRLPGVEIKARLFRQYPYESLASHAIGYIGRITKKDEEWIEEKEQSPNYRGTEHIGKAGLEQFYELDLHGQTGFEEVEIDAGGRAIRRLKMSPPVSGNNLSLTLDAKLQQITDWRPRAGSGWPRPAPGARRCPPGAARSAPGSPGQFIRGLDQPG